MSEDWGEKYNALRREAEAMAKCREEEFARIKAMDPADKEAIKREIDAVLERNEEYKRRLEVIINEKWDDMMNKIERWKVEKPGFAEWFEGFQAEQERTFREKNEQEGWHEIIE
ncbi:MAG: hypothetical protein KBD94_09990 [Pyrinomonadaceae bacterium]|nr:hypothetical protein [Pyrinomonadaceae bacterium]